MIDWEPGIAISEIRIMGAKTKPNRIIKDNRRIEKYIPVKKVNYDEITSWEDWEITHTGSSIVIPDDVYEEEDSPKPIKKHRRKKVIRRKLNAPYPTSLDYCSYCECYIQHRIMAQHKRTKKHIKNLSLV